MEYAIVTKTGCWYIAKIYNNIGDCKDKLRADTSGAIALWLKINNITEIYTY